MINPKNKRVQVTLPGETAELLESLSNRYHKSNSEIVKWAINVLAAKKHHNIVIKLSEQTESSNNEQKEYQSEEYYKKLRERFEDEKDKEMKKILDDETLSDEEKDKIIMDMI